MNINNDLPAAQLPEPTVAEVELNDDPEPQAPYEPALEECCNSGCEPCIFDLYAEQLNAYRVAHLAWKARQTGKSSA
ncbi:oxidoreductase-like domain-containing protein [Chitinibacter sp. S2-10]|uniref:oxidoreductase-like domain-containing protein n=1 Tax=Chitinibacter sp. S2-10 TaxID=3373597 RepID=UPI0039777646